MYHFSNSVFYYEHGRQPRGRGWWAFQNRDGSKIWWVEGSYTLTEAKKRVTEILKQEGIPAGTIIYVAP